MLPDWVISALIFFGFLSVVLGPVAILLLPDLGRYRGLHGMLQKLALKGVGRLDDVVDGPMPVPRLTAQGGGHALTVMPDVANEDDYPGSVLFAVRGSLPLPRLEVHPREPAARTELVGLSAVPTGDTLMDQEYVAMTSDPAAWDKLKPKVGPALERLSHTGEKPAFALSADGRRISIRRLNPPKDDAEMEALMVRVAELVDALVDVKAVEAVEAPEGCHYCGQALAAIELRCRRCATAYHAACFRGPGGCSMYPCTCVTPVTDLGEVPQLAEGQS